MIRWIDASSVGVRFYLVTGLNLGDRVMAIVHSRDCAEYGLLRDKLGFSPVGDRPALQRKIKGLSVSAILDALPGSKQVFVKREDVLFKIGHSEPTAASDAEDGPDFRKTRGAPELEPNEFQVPYAPLSRIGNPTMMVPVHLQESTQAALDRFAAKYGDIDEFVASNLGWTKEELKSRLLPEQVDGVGLWLSRYLSGESFVLVDETGVGKGRQLAAALWFSITQGKLPIFITHSENLFSDFLRDLRDIGCADRVRPFILNSGVKVLDNQENVVWASPGADTIRAALEQKAVPEGYNAVFATYSQFNSSRYNPLRKSPRNLKAEWLESLSKGQFLILDESHNAAGQSNTNVNVFNAVCGAESVLYSSATFMKRAENIKIYHRIFPQHVNLASINAAIEKGGVQILETLSSMLTATGSMIRREKPLLDIVYDFTTENDPVRIERNIDATNRFADFIYGMLRLSSDIKGSIKSHNAKLRKVVNSIESHSAASINVGFGEFIRGANFASTMVSMARQFYACLKVDKAAEIALEDLKNGRKPIVFSELSGESLLAQVMSEEDRVVEVFEDGRSKIRMPTFADLLNCALDKVWNAYCRLYELKNTSVPKPFVDLFDSLREIAASFSTLPLCPLDIIASRIRAAGYTCDEISGRQNILTFGANGEVFVEGLPKRNRFAIVNRFQHGEVDALVMTSAGTTGISLHADRTAADKRERHMIVLDPPGDVIKAVQVAGRVARYGQLSTPTVTFMSSGIVGEIRRQSLLNRALRSLNATTTSNQESATINQNIPDVMNVVGEKVAVAVLEDHPEIRKRTCIDIDSHAAPSELYHVNRLTGRIIMLPNALQEQVWDILTDEYENKLMELEQNGQNPLRTAEMNWKDAVLEKEIIYQDGVEDDPFLTPVTIQTVSYRQTVNPIRLSRIMKIISDSRGQLSADPRTAGGDGIQGMLEHVRKMRDEVVAEITESGLTVEDVLSDKAVGKKFLGARLMKLEKLKKLAENASPGKGISFVHEFTGEQISGLIVRIKLPPQGMERLLGRYVISMAIPGESSIKEYSFHVIGDNPGFFTPSRKYMAAFDEARPQSLSLRRHMLGGNLFEAAAIANSLNTGRLVRWRDCHGNARRGFLLPQDFRVEHLLNSSVVLEDPALIAAYISHVEKDSSANRHWSLWNAKGVTLTPSGDGVRVHMDVRNTALGKMLNKNNSLSALAEGECWQGRWYYTIQYENIPQVLKVLSENGVGKFEASPRDRELINLLRKKLLMEAQAGGEYSADKVGAAAKMREDISAAG